MLKNMNLNNKKVIMISAVALIIVVLVLVINSMVDLKNRESSVVNYKKYEEEMNIYDFSKLYNSKNPKSSDYLTKIEGIKLALGVILNTDKIELYAQTSNKDINDTWLDVAQSANIISKEERLKFDKNSKIKYFEFILFFERAFENYTKNENNSEIKNVLINQDNYSDEIKKAFSFLIDNGVIVEEQQNIDANKIVLKGYANEISVNIAKVFSLLTINNKNLKKDTLPSNYNDYPYLLEEIDNEVYEQDFKVIDSSKFINPKYLYASKKLYYPTIKRYISNYFNTLLNINYENLDFDKYFIELNKYLDEKIDRDVLKKYYDYVVTNKIKIDVSNKFIEPCVYFDGENYRARIVLKLNIVNSQTRDNILPGDLLNETNYSYEKNEYLIYVDAKLNEKKEKGILYIEKFTNLREIALNF